MPPSEVVPAFAKALRSYLQGVAAEGQIRSFVVRVLTASQSGGRHNMALPDATEADQFALHAIGHDSWLPAVLTVFPEVVKSHEDITTAGHMFTAAPTTIETRFVFCASGRILAQLMSEEPFINVVDALNDACARVLKRACLIEMFIPLQEPSEAVENMHFFVALKVM